MRRPANPEPIDPDAPTPGDFFADGSWSTHRDHDQSHDRLNSLYWFVDMLVTARRRTPAKPPWEYALRIQRSRFRAAFPAAVSTDLGARWTSTIPFKGQSVALPWWGVSVCTSAETAVLLAGFRPDQSQQLLALLKAEADARSDLHCSHQDLLSALDRLHNQLALLTPP